VAEGFSGEPGVAHGLLEQCSKRVPELVGVKHLDAELLRELAVHVLRTGDGKPVGAGGLVHRLQANEQSGRRIFSGVEVVLDTDPGLVGHLDDALAVAFAEHPQALQFPLAAVEPEDFGAARAGGEQQDQRPVAFLRQGVVGERLQELIPVTGFQLLGWPFGQRGHLNGDPLDRGAATLRGRRTAGTRRYDHSRDSLDRQRRLQRRRLSRLTTGDNAAPWPVPDYWVVIGAVGWVCRCPGPGW
jgi:hypothetical protein